MKKFIAVLILCIITAVPQSAFAASLNLNAESSSNISAGENFTVDVKYSSDYLDSIKGSVSYDTDLLEYISGGSSTGDGGIIKLKGSSDNGKTVEFNLKFKALKTGTASVAISTEEAYDLDGKAMNTPYVTRNITIEEISANEPAGNTGDGDSGSADNSSSDKNGTDTAKSEDTQHQKNSRLLEISAGIIAVLLITVSIIAAVKKKKRKKKRQKILEERHMAENRRPENMERITTPELARAFIDEQLAALRRQIGVRPLCHRLCEAVKAQARGWVARIGQLWVRPGAAVRGFFDIAARDITIGKIQLVGGHAVQGALHLQGNPLVGDAGFPLLQTLAHADNGVHAGVQHGVHLLVDGLIRFTEVLAALTVAYDDILHTQILQHIGGNLAGVSALLLKVQVLSTHRDPELLEGLHGGGDVAGGDTDQGVAPLGAGHDLLQVLGEFLGLGGGHVHLPVAGDDSLTVSAVHNSFFSFCIFDNDDRTVSEGRQGGPKKARQ